MILSSFLFVGVVSCQTSKGPCDMPGLYFYLTNFAPPERK